VNLTWLVHRGIVGLPLLVERMSCAPARLFKLPGGTLRKGSIADVTVFDSDASWTVDPAAFRSKGRNTPYAGQTLRGLVELTVVGGRIIHRRAE
jgi:dihydroorotase